VLYENRFFMSDTKSASDLFIPTKFNPSTPPSSIPAHPQHLTRRQKGLMNLPYAMFWSRFSAAILGFQLVVSESCGLSISFHTANVSAASPAYLIAAR
jgi:hypothetical protein